MYHVVKRKCKRYDPYDWQDKVRVALHWSLNRHGVGSLWRHVCSIIPQDYPRGDFIFTWALHGGANYAILHDIWTNIMSDDHKHAIRHAILFGLHDLFQPKRTYTSSGSILGMVQFLWERVYSDKQVSSPETQNSMYMLHSHCLTVHNEEQAFLAIQWLKELPQNVYAMPSYLQLYKNAIYVQNAPVAVQLWNHEKQLWYHDEPVPNTVDFEFWFGLADGMREYGMLADIADFERLLHRLHATHGIPNFKSFWIIYNNIFAACEERPMPPTIVHFMDDLYDEICASPRQTERDKERGFIQGLAIIPADETMPTKLYAHMHLKYTAEIVAYITPANLQEMNALFPAWVRVMLKAWGLLHILQ